MPSEFSPIVRIAYLDGPAAVSRLRDLAQRLVVSHPEVISIILFGSLVRGDYAPGSDADLLIILKADERRMIDRIPDYLREFLDALIPVDVFPYTLAELDRMRASGNHFIERALREGLTLAGRPA